MNPAAHVLEDFLARNGGDYEKAAAELAACCVVLLRQRSAGYVRAKLPEGAISERAEPIPQHTELHRPGEN